MKVKELIAQLQRLNPEADVRMAGGSNPRVTHVGAHAVPTVEEVYIIHEKRVAPSGRR